MHLWMETYFFYCSVRLGVLVIATLTLLELIIPSILFLSIGIKVFDPIIELFQADDVYSKSIVVKRIIGWIENSPTNFMLIVNTFLLMHSIFCVLAIYGTIKLLKWYLVPFIVVELLRVIFCLTWHIVLMIVLKKLINLGVLIALTLSGGFLILFLGYNWAACVALYQIINLVHSKRYRAIYGDDPFDPISNPEIVGKPHPYGTVENVRVLVTPDENDIDEQKQINDAAKFKWKRLQPGQQPIIAVIPVQSGYVGGIFLGHNYINSRRLLQEKQEDNSKDEVGYSSDYKNWQWNELVGGHRRHQQRSFLIGQH